MRNLTSVLQCQCTPIGLLTLLDGIFERLVLLVSKETEPGQRAYAVSPMNLQMPKVAGQSGGGTSACSNIQGIVAQVDAVVVAAVHQEQEGDVPLRKFNSWHWRGKNI